MTIPITRLDPRKKGLERWFGPLEAEIMTLFWASDADLTTQEVLDRMNESTNRPRPYAYTTIMTIISRLYKRGLLVRTTTVERKGGGYHYRATCTQREYEQIQTRAALAALEQVSV